MIVWRTDECSLLLQAVQVNRERPGWESYLNPLEVTAKNANHYAMPHPHTAIEVHFTVKKVFISKNVFVGSILSYFVFIFHTLLMIAKLYIFTVDNIFVLEWFYCAKNKFYVFSSLPRFRIVMSHHFFQSLSRQISVEIPFTIFNQHPTVSGLLGSTKPILAFPQKVFAQPSAHWCLPPASCMFTSLVA